MPSGTRNGSGRPPVLHGAAPVAGWRRSPVFAPESVPALHRLALCAAAVAFVLTIIGSEMARRGGGPVPGLLISTGAGAAGLLSALTLLVLVGGDLYGGPHPPSNALVFIGPEPDPGRASVMFRRRARLWTDGNVLGFIGAERVEHRWPLHGPDGLTAIEVMPLPGGVGHVLRLRSADGRLRGHLRTAQWFPRGTDPSVSRSLGDLAAAAGLALRDVPYRSAADPEVTLDHYLGPHTTRIMPWQSMAMFDLLSGGFLALVASLMVSDAAWAPLSLVLGIVTTVLSALAIVAMYRPARLSVRGRHGA